MKSAIKYSTQVSAAIAAGTPIVALESTIISHGLPRPSNLLVAQECESIIRARGAVPATIALLDGVVHIGLEASELDAIANRDDISKASSRDLAIIIAQGKSAATTVAATAHIAAIAGIKVFATGGLGGVHRGANESFDESADLTALSQLDMTVVCAGVKSILDVHATLERLVSALCGLGEDRDAAGVGGILAGQETTVGDGVLQVVGADVVGPALQQRDLDRRLQRVADHWQVLVEQLVLQGLGAGRHDHLAARLQRRHQVGERLARAGAGLGNEHRLAVDGGGDALGHFKLLTAHAITADGLSQRPVGGEDFGKGRQGRRPEKSGANGSRWGGGRRWRSGWWSAFCAWTLGGFSEPFLNSCFPP